MTFTEGEALRTGGAAASRVEIAPADIVIGRDILELITAAMYTDPMSIYREYVQNAADAIDDAREEGLVGRGDTPRIEIALDQDSRTVRIRDNGVSIPAHAFARRLLAIGGSAKRGTTRRGFRGIGRLAGLGYCQELLFRGRAEGEAAVTEVKWDARALRQALRSLTPDDNLSTTIRDIAEVVRQSTDGMPARFFEVELRKVVRIKNDVLLNPELVSGYLGHVAPVPFDPDFAFGAEIGECLAAHGVREPVEICVNGGAPLSRPFTSSFDVSKIQTDRFTAVSFVEVPGVDGGIDAVGWVLDHGYYGSLSRSGGIGGLRIRSGDMQVGGSDIVAELFTEPRFNGWAVAEFHVLTPKIVPNGRRDNFEYNAHYANLQSHLARLAGDLSRACRSRSRTRQTLRTIKERIVRTEGDLPLVRTIPSKLAFRDRQLEAMKTTLTRCVIAVAQVDGHEEERSAVERRIATLQTKIERARKENGNGKVFARLPAAKRQIYAEVLSGIYETLGDLPLAHETVLRLLKQASKVRRRPAR